MILHPKIKTIKPRLGPHIRRRRVALKLSLREVCRRMEMQPSVVSRIENGYFMPSMNTIVKLSQVLDLDIDKLIRLTTHDTNLKKKGSLK